MMDCKAMNTPMTSNMELLSDASLEMVDATMYCQMIGSLMYLTNMRPDIFFVVLDRSETCSLDCYKHILRYLRGTIDYEFKYEVN